MQTKKKQIQIPRDELDKMEKNPKFSEVIYKGSKPVSVILDINEYVEAEFPQHDTKIVCHPEMI